MKARLWLLAAWLAISPLWAEETTNLIEILRSFQAQLDAQEHSAAAPTTATPAVPPSASLPTVSAPAPVSGQPNRTLQPGDLLSLRVVGEPSLSANQMEVAEGGTITLPLLNLEISVKGNTIEQARTLIHDVLQQDYLVAPVVELGMIQAAEEWFTISNQVAAPGKYRLRRDPPLDVVNAIGLAGGATRKADLTQVVIRRETNGTTHLIRVNLSELSRNRTMTAPRVEPGDAIEVPSK